MAITPDGEANFKSRGDDEQSFLVMIDSFVVNLLLLLVLIVAVQAGALWRCRCLAMVSGTVFATGVALLPPRPPSLSALFYLSQPVVQ